MLIVCVISSLQGLKIDSDNIYIYISHLCAFIETSDPSLQFAWLSTKVSIDNTPTVISHLTVEETLDQLTYAFLRDQPCVQVRRSIDKFIEYEHTQLYNSYVHHCHSRKRTGEHIGG